MQSMHFLALSVRQLSMPCLMWNTRAMHATSILLRLNIDDQPTQNLANAPAISLTVFSLFAFPFPSFSADPFPFPSLLLFSSDTELSFVDDPKISLFRLELDISRSCGRDLESFKGVDTVLLARRESRVFSASQEIFLELVPPLAVRKALGGMRPRLVSPLSTLSRGLP